MENVWTITTASALFLILGFLLYKGLGAYVRNAFGKKWLKVWGNKVYFWQSVLFTSIASTVLVMYVLKWSNVVTF